MPLFGMDGDVANPYQVAIDGAETQVQVRVVFGADFTSTRDGIAFDDVVIAEKTPIELGPDTTLCIGQRLV